MAYPLSVVYVCFMESCGRWSNSTSSLFGIKPALHIQGEVSLIKYTEIRLPLVLLKSKFLVLEDGVEAGQGQG